MDLIYNTQWKKDVRGKKYIFFLEFRFITLRND